MITIAKERRVGAGARRAFNLVRLYLVALVLPYTGGQKEKVAPPRAGFNQKPGGGAGAQATIGKMDTYDKGFAREKTGKTEINDTNGLNRTRRITRGTEACILTS